MEQKFDAIIVGAGPAGCACAYKLAKAGLQALVVERGKFAGAKNMWGGAFYGPVLGDLLPDFWKEAPIERYLTHQRISTVSGDSCLSLTSRRRNSLKYPITASLFSGHGSTSGSPTKSRKRVSLSPADWQPMT